MVLKMFASKKYRFEFIETSTISSCVIEAKFLLAEPLNTPYRCVNSLGYIYYKINFNK
jgi:hypothetical protein